MSESEYPEYDFQSFYDFFNIRTQEHGLQESGSKSTGSQVSNKKQKLIDDKLQTIIVDINEMTRNKRYENTNLNTHANELKNLVDANGTEDYNNIIKNYNKLLVLRSNIDVKLQELYGMPGSMNDTFIQGYDSTMYLSVIWTVLATSMLYFIFIKL